MKMLVMTVLAFLNGCAVDSGIVDLNVMSDKYSLNGREVPLKSVAAISGVGREAGVRISFSPDVSFKRMVEVFSFLNTNNIESVVRLNNGNSVALRVGAISDYMPFHLYNQANRVHCCHRGNVFVVVSEEISDDDRLLLPLWGKLGTTGNRADEIPEGRAGMRNCLELFCEYESDFEDLEGVLIRASEKGYDSVFMIGLVDQDGSY